MSEQAGDSGVSQPQSVSSLADHRNSQEAVDEQGNNLLPPSASNSNETVNEQVGISDMVQPPGASTSVDCEKGKEAVSKQGGCDEIVESSSCQGAKHETTEHEGVNLHKEGDVVKGETSLVALPSQLGEKAAKARTGQKKRSSTPKKKVVFPKNWQIPIKQTKRNIFDNKIQTQNSNSQIPMPRKTKTNPVIRLTMTNIFDCKGKKAGCDAPVLQDEDAAAASSQSAPSAQQKVLSEAEQIACKPEAASQSASARIDDADDIGDLFGSVKSEVASDGGSGDGEPWSEGGESEELCRDDEVLMDQKGVVDTKPRLGQAQRKKKKKDDADDTLDMESMQPFLGPDGQVDMIHFLSNLAQHYVKVACDELGGNEALAFDENIAMGSLCSGSGAGELAFSAATAALSEHFMRPLQPHVAFCCEKESWKQAFLQNHITQNKCCIFTDVVQLGEALSGPSDLDSKDTEGLGEKKKDETEAGQPRCETHKSHSCHEAINDEPISILKSGFSCTGNSRMNIRYSEYRTSFQQGDTGNCSVSTFFGTCDVISATKPSVAILENVDMGPEVQDSNMSKVISDLESIDDGMYSVKAFHLSADSYILPQTRTIPPMTVRSMNI